MTQPYKSQIEDKIHKQIDHKFYTNLKIMTTPMQNTPKTIEDLVKEFGNKLAFKLNPSNDTMEAIRLLRKELPELLAEQDRISRENFNQKLEEIEREVNEMSRYTDSRLVKWENVLQIIKNKKI